MLRPIESLWTVQFLENIFWHDILWMKSKKEPLDVHDNLRGCLLFA